MKMKLLSKMTLMAISATLTSALAPDASALVDPQEANLVQFEKNLADPDVFVDGTTLWVVATGPDTTRIPIYSGDSLPLSWENEYVPPGYCHLWAPDLEKIGNKYRLSFTGAKLGPQQECDDNKVSVYYVEVNAISDLWNVDVTKQVQMYLGADQPNTTETGQGWASMRIDPDILLDGNQMWMSYTRFGDGNSLGVFDLNDTSSGSAESKVTKLVTIPDIKELYNSHRKYQNNDPATNIRKYTPIYEGSNIVKGQNGRYYLFYSAGGFDNDYHLMVKHAATVDGLATAPARQLTFPTYGSIGNLIDNRGHSSTFYWGNKWYIAYHRGYFNNGFKRELKYSELQFDGDDVRPLTGFLANHVGYTPKQVHSGRCIDVPDGHLDSKAVDYGLRLRQWECNGALAQKWHGIELTLVEGAYKYLIRSNATGLCLTASSTANGNEPRRASKIHQEPCHGKPSQRFLLEDTGSSRLRLAMQGEGNERLCVETGTEQIGMRHEWAKSPGAELMLWTCVAKNENQLWELTP